MKQKDYDFNLKFLEETSLGMLSLSKKKRFELPFRIYRIQIKPDTNVYGILTQIQESFFDKISTSYNYDNIYFFAVPEDFELVLETLKNLNPESIETIGAGFIDKIENQFLSIEFFMHYKNKRASRGIVKIDGAKLEWKGEPAFTLEKGKE
ncbi:hypothetical protein J4480_04250 [Candidatus Woesearchaeota archaeon]|nr:hypothetical protein [Candidatus Woesearchaeota archaeon]